MPAKITELTKKRKALIQEAIQTHGFIKKFQVIKHFEGHELFQIHNRTFRDLIEFEPDDILDAGHIITGRSVLKDSEGKVKQEWVKTSVDKEKVLEATRLAVEELTSEIEPYKPVKLKKKKLNKNLCNQYTITDYHLGMMALECEVGTDWNIEIAEKLILDWFSLGIQKSQDAESCVFAQIGDFLHFDSMEAVTPASKHLLDTNTRFAMLVRVAIRVLKQIIIMLLKKYKHVKVILAEGNHDMSSSIWLRESFAMFFENNPRVEIDQSVIPYYAHLFGDTLLMYHHGHKKDLKSLDKGLAAQYKQEFGKSKYVYTHTGHYHHEKIIESSLMIIEQHPTLSPKDAYSARGLYHSYRNSKIITYHKSFGEVGRITISPEMLKL